MEILMLRGDHTIQPKGDNLVIVRGVRFFSEGEYVMLKEYGAPGFVGTVQVTDTATMRICDIPDGALVKYTKLHIRKWDEVYDDLAEHHIMLCDEEIVTLVWFSPDI